VRGRIDQLAPLLWHFACEVAIEDVQTLIDHEEYESAQHIMRRSEPGWFDQYHSYTEIVEYMTALAGRFAGLAEFIPSIGKSVEGRDIPALRIRQGKSAPKTIFFSGGIHAREHIAVSTVLYLATRLLEDSEQLEVNYLLSNLEFDIVPLANPDGYEYSRNR